MKLQKSKCVVCESEFLQCRISHIYCKDCAKERRKAFQKKYLRGKYQKEINCEICNLKFLSFNPKGKFCLKCRKIKKKEYSKKYRLKNRDYLNFKKREYSKSEKGKLQKKKWVLLNQDKIKESKKKDRLKNPKRDTLSKRVYEKKIKTFFRKEKNLRDSIYQKFKITINIKEIIKDYDLYKNLLEESKLTKIDKNWKIKNEKIK